MAQVTKETISDEYKTLKCKQNAAYDAARNEYQIQHRGQYPDSTISLTVYGYDESYWKGKFESLKRKAEKNKIILGADGSVKDKPAPPPPDPNVIRMMEEEKAKAERAKAEMARREAERKKEDERRKQEEKEEKRRRKEEEKKAKDPNTVVYQDENITITNKDVSDALKKRDEELKKQKKEEERKRKEEEHEKAKAERERRKKAFDEDLKRQKEEYARQREQMKKERKEREAKEAEDRKKKFDEDKKNRIKQAENDGIEARRKIAEMAQKELNETEKRKKNGELYSGSSKQALQEGKDAMKDLWSQMGLGTQINTTRAQLENNRDQLTGAAADINGILTNGLGTLAHGTANGIAQGAKASAQQKNLLDLQMQLASQQFAGKMVIDMIGDQVYDKIYGAKNVLKNTQDMLMLQKAYISAYLKQTFGNPAFMSNVATIAYTKINNYVEALTVEQVNKVTGKIDNAYEKIDKKLEQTSTKITNKLDKLSKIDIMKNLNDKLTNVVSFKGLEDKLNKSPLGKLIAPAVGEIGSACNLAISAYVMSSPVGKALSIVKDKVLKLQKGIAKAKEFVQQKIQMARQYLEGLKNKAKAAVTQFAKKIVSDITAKISVGIKGAIGKGF